MGTRTDSDDFEVIMGPSDEREYARYADELIMEFAREGVKGTAVGQGMMAQIPMGKILVLGVLLPYGFPAKRPTLKLVEPDPTSITHEFINAEGFVTHSAIAEWRAPQPLAPVVRKVLADLMENPPRAKAVKIDWGLPSEPSEPVEVKETPKVAVEARKEAEAPPLVHQPFPSLSGRVPKDFPPAVLPPRRSAPVVPLVEPAPEIPLPPAFDLSSHSLASLQKFSENPAQLTVQYRQKLVEIESEVESRDKLGRMITKMKDEVVLSETRQRDLVAKAAALREELAVARVCKQDVISRLENDTLLKNLRATLSEHQANLQAVEAEYERTKQQSYLEAIYYPIAYEYHLASIKYNQVAGGL